MLPDKCKLAVCPHCGHKKEIVNLISGNTFGSKMWSDARRISPMFLSPSPIQKCPNCEHFFFLSDVQIEDGESYSFQTGWLTFEESVKALDELDGGKLAFVAVLVLWAYNDIFRNDGEPTEEQSRVLKDKLTECLKDESMLGNPMMMAEMYRTIGEYDECIRILNDFSADNDFVEGIKQAMLEKAKNRDNRVFEIQQE